VAGVVGRGLRYSGVDARTGGVGVTATREIEQFRRQLEQLLARFRFLLTHDSTSAMERNVAASPRTSSVVTTVSSQAASSSRILAGGPTSAMSSTRLVGIAAAASFLWPAK